MELDKQIRTIPIDVLDKFLTMTKDSNDVYGALVSAIDTMSAKIMDMEERIASWEQTVQDENLGQVMHECIQRIKDDIGALKTVISALDSDSLRKLVQSLPNEKFNLLKNLEDCMVFDNGTEQEVKELSKSIIWFTKFITYIRNHVVFYAFFGGLILAMLLLSSGVSLWDTFKLFIKGH